MRKLIKLEKISTNRKNIQKKWNKKWLIRGIFTCVVAIALIGSCRYISGIVKVSSNVNGKELPIYCVQTDEKKVALSFDAPLANGLLEHWKYLFVPALSLGIVQAAYITRMTRSSLLEVLYKNYIRTARAKGLKERKVVLRYALKNAAPAILTAVGQSFGSLITGTIVTETLFNIPGLGMLTMGSINRRDVYVIQGVVLFVTLLYVLVNLVVDILYGFVDPRLQPGRNK